MVCRGLFTVLIAHLFQPMTLAENERACRFVQLYGGLIALFGHIARRA